MLRPRLNDYYISEKHNYYDYETYAGDLVTYLNTFEKHHQETVAANLRLKNALDKAAILIEKMEKDACYYCPFGCNPSTNNYDACIDPEGRLELDGCRAEYIREFLFDE